MLESEFVLIHFGRFVIYVKAGIYNEIVLVDKKFVNLTMYGDGNTKTIVTGNLNFKDGVQTFKTATFGATKFNLYSVTNFIFRYYFLTNNYLNISLQ